MSRLKLFRNAEHDATVPHVAIGGAVTIECRVNRRTPMTDLKRITSDITREVQQARGGHVSQVKVKFVFDNGRTPRYHVH